MVLKVFHTNTIVEQKAMMSRKKIPESLDKENYRFQIYVENDLQKIEYCN